LSGKADIDDPRLGVSSPNRQSPSQEISKIPSAAAIFMARFSFHFSIENNATDRCTAATTPAPQIDCSAL
jgi:hypothetical protein